MAVTARGKRITGRRLGPWLQLTPGTIYFAIFFLAPLGILIVYSFWTTRNFEFLPDFTLSNYGEVATSDIFRPFFLRTIKLAMIISLIVVFVSYPFAYVTNYVFRRKRQILYFLVLVSLFGGYLVRIYAWRTILGRQGIINTTLESVGLIDEPLRFFLNSQFAIVIASVNFLIPLGVLPIFSAMQNVSPRLIEAARDLGASRIQAARQIVLPLSIRGVRAAFAFSFIAAAAEWVTPALLGGAKDQMIGNQIAFQFGGNFDWPLGAALAMGLVILVVTILILISVPLRRLMR